MLQFRLAQLRKRRAEAELLAIARVDTAHQRLDHAIVQLAPQAALYELRQRLIAVERPGWNEIIHPHAQLAPRRNQTRLGHRPKARWNQPRQTFRQIVE